MSGKRDRRTLDYESTRAPQQPQRPWWNHLVLAIVATPIAAVLLLAGIAGWYAQVFGDADVGGCVVWVILVLGFWSAYEAWKQWRTLWQRRRR